MLLDPLAFHARTCIHEAGHAVAAFGVGASIDFGEVAPVDQLRSCSGRVRAEVAGLENELTVLVAGELATDPTMPVVTIIRVGADMAKARARVAGHLYPGEQLDIRQLEPQLSPYLERAALRVRPWLAYDEQQRAIEAIARALAEASQRKGQVPGAEICRICEESGVVRQAVGLWLEH